ncbi:MAG: hypothetical protein RL148_1341 [Planctomycetota bacterium]|jgi:hypothetical protein
MTSTRESGFGFVEMVIALAILASVVLSISSLMQTGASAQDQGKRMRRLTELSQEVTDEVRSRMLASTRVYGNDEGGNAMMMMLDLSHSPQRTGVRRLPTIDFEGSFREDRPGDLLTGNTLLFSYLAWRDEFQCTSGKQYLVDVFRVVHLYLSPVGTGPSEQEPGGLDLVRFVSEPLIDADSVYAITDPVDRAEVLVHLCNATPDVNDDTKDPAHVVWHRNVEVNTPGALKQIDRTSGVLSESVIPGTGRPSVWRILTGREGAVCLLALRRASVASNFDSFAGSEGRLGLLDLQQGFPHGFEVQVVGPTSARKVLVRLVLVETSRGGLPVWNEFQTILPAHSR